MSGKRGRPPGPRLSLPERLARRRHVDDVTDCWEWLGAIDNKGYGRITVARKTAYVHRVSWELEHGTIPADMVIDHVCENRACFNPRHLELVTVGENTRRRQNSQASRTHCPEGHRFAGDNLRVYVDKRGFTHRICVACNKIRCREWHATRKARVASAT